MTSGQNMYLCRICLVQIIFPYLGIKYSSPTLAAALGNLIPGFTFLFAVIFRMEKVSLRNTASVAKIIGTLVSISGAFLVTFYKGPPILKAICGTVFRNSIYPWCLEKKGPVFVALFKPMGTGIAVVFGMMFLGETPHIGSLIGALVITLGFYAVMWGQNKENDILAGKSCCILEPSTQKSPLLQST